MNIVGRYTELDYAVLKNLSGIYLIENRIDGKRYVGESKYIGKRMKVHLQELVSNRHHNIHLQRAVNSYGIEQFKFDIIELCEPWETKRREHHWATLLYVHDGRYGYNIEPTDPDGHKQVSEETRKKIGDAHRGKVMSLEQLEKNRNRVYLLEWTEAMKKSKEGKPVKPMTEEHKKKIDWTGRKHTDESRKKMSNSQRGKKMEKELAVRMKEQFRETRGLAVVMLTSIGEFVQEFRARKEAGEYLHVKGGRINTAIKNNWLVSDYMFVNANEYTPEEVTRRIEDRKTKKEECKKKISVAYRTRNTKCTGVSGAGD